MKKFILKIAAFFLAVILPFTGLIVTDLASPDVYGETFLAGLGLQMKQLRETEGRKIVIIGGSSVLFGVDAKLLGELLPDYEVVNFGLYASLGTKVMLDLSHKYIQEGDIVILAPELDSEPLSPFFNAETIWQAMESDRSMLLDLPYSDFGPMAGGYFGYLSDKMEHRKMEHVLSSGIYSITSFGEKAELICPRPHNTMLRGYDPTFEIDLSEGLYDSEMVDYINEYADDVQKKGAVICMSFSPVNRAALKNSVTEESIAQFFSDVCRLFRFEVITNINDCIMDPGYFFDTNFHLNEAGMTLHTAMLAEDVRRVLGDPTPVILELPDIPEKPGNQTQTLSETNASTYFIYEALDGGWSVIGVTEEGKKLRHLTTPTSHEGAPVLEAAERAFEGCAAETITITANIVQMNGALFTDCPNLRIIELKAKNAEIISAGRNLLDGAPEDAMLMVSKDAFATFISHYFWAAFADRMTTPEKEE